MFELKHELFRELVLNLSLQSAPVFVARNEEMSGTDAASASSRL